jgi:hypothetical protein
MSEHEYVGAEVRKTIGDVGLRLLLRVLGVVLWWFRRLGLGGWSEGFRFFFGGRGDDLVSVGGWMMPNGNVDL